MKYIKLIVFGLILNILFISSFSAKSSLSCDSEVEIGANIKCTVNIENDPVMIESDGNIKIIDISGNSYSKINTYQATFKDNGIIYFGPAQDKYSKYIISIKNEDGDLVYDKDQRVNVIAKKTTTTKSRSNNNYLSYIKFNGNIIDGYDKNVFKYNIEVANDVEKVNIEAEPEDNTATISLNGPKELEIGDNEFTIKVVSEDETIRFYKVIVTRKDKISSNTKIKYLEVTGYDIKFDGKSKTYYLKIKNNEDKLKILVELEDDKAKYEIKGNENLEDGSSIKIIVSAENNETDTYRIIVNKDELPTNKKKNNMLLIIIISVVVVIILGLSTYFIIKKKKKNKVKNEEEINEDITKEVKVDKKKKDESKDNDDLEKTKTLNYDELKTLEKEIEEDED